jgi:predicted TIM-barrel fold metal-dependent hydrolase
MPDPLNSIDVHCHIFNGRDLPIDKFLRNVVLVNYPSIVGDLLEPLIFLLTEIMQKSAPKFDAELKVLDGLASSKLAMRQQYANTPEQERQIVSSALKKLLARGKAAPRRGATRATIPLEKRLALVDRLHFRATRGLRFQTQFDGGDLDKLAGLLLVGGEDLLQFIPWALIFPNYRFIILDKLAHLADANAEIAFYVPAMVDFDYELGDFSATSQKDQVTVMSKISSLSNRPYAMHGYVAYDPRRHIVTNGESFKDVQDAVTTGGFIGAKIYPSMGFMPIGNAGKTYKVLRGDGSKTTISISGDQLDAALIKFYTWCVSADVPLMAHCGCSNYASPDFKCYGSPGHWQQVLDHKDFSGNQPFRTLRLNLGHSGGLPDYGKSGDGKGFLPKTIEMISSGNYPNLYGDIAYDSVVLERDSNEKGYDDTVMGFLKKNWNQPNVAQKIMYGSDWSMIGLEFHNEEFYSDVKLRFGNLLGSPMELNALLKGNAAKFLGLANTGQAKTQSRLRLEQFYQKNNLNIAILDKFV